MKLNGILLSLDECLRYRDSPAFQVQPLSAGLSVYNSKTVLPQLNFRRKQA